MGRRPQVAVEKLGAFIAGEVPGRAAPERFETERDGACLLVGGSLTRGAPLVGDHALPVTRAL